MNTMLTIAYRCHFAGSVLLALMGVVYLCRKKFMPYHAEALDQSWEELGAPARTLFIASMKIIGSAWIALALALILLLRNGFREELTWAIYGVPLIGLTFSLPTLLAVFRVRASTRASPPWPPLAVVVVLFLVGFMLSVAAST